MFLDQLSFSFVSLAEFTSHVGEVVAEICPDIFTAALFCSQPLDRLLYDGQGGGSYAAALTPPVDVTP